MKTLKKLFSVSAIVALLGTLMPINAFAANYSDELQEAYAYALSNGITTMKTIDSADMYGSLTRVAMAKMIANYATTVLGLEPDTSAKCTFSDVTAALDAQYDNGVTKACQLGLMGQNITAFRPNDLVTRAEFGTTLSRALNANSDDLEAMNAANPYYKDHLNFLKAEGIMNQIDNPSMTEVRGYVMLMMMRADKGYTPNEKCSLEEMVACALAEDTDACLAACTGNEESEEPVGNGLVKVSRVGSTTSQTVAANAVEKKVGTIKLTAGEYDSTVSSIVISKSGLGGGDVEFSIQRDGVIVSNKQTLKENKNSVTVRFSPALTIKAGKSETFDIVASFDTYGNDHFDFSVSDVNVSNGKAEGTPVALGSIDTKTYYLTTIAAPTITAGGDQMAGDKDKTFAEVRITLPNKEVKLDGVVISKIKGSKDFTDVMNNVKAYINGEEVGKVTVSPEKIIVKNLNIVKSYGENVTIELKDDCIFVGDSEDLEINVLENDVIAYETSTEERLPSGEATKDTITFDGIDLQANNEITSSKTVAPGTSNVELFKAKLTANASFEITEYEIVELGDAVDPANFNSIVAYVNGVDYELDLDETIPTPIWSFDKKESVTIDKNSPIEVKIVANLSADAAGSYQFGLNLIEGVNDNNAEIDVSSVTVQGHVTTVNVGGFSLTRQNNTPTNKTVLEGQPSDMLYFKLRANSEDQIMKELTVTSTQTLSDIATKVELMKGSTVVKAITNTTDLNSTTVTFENLSERLRKDEDVNYTVRLTLKAGEVTSLGTKVQLSVDPSSDVIVVRAADTSATTTSSSPALEGTNYSIASNTPSVKLTDQVSYNTDIKFTNNSQYNVVLEAITYTITQNNTNGTYVDWNGTTAILDAANSTTFVAGDGSDTVPGEAILTFDAAYANLDSVLEYVIELKDPQHTVNPENYTVTVKSLDFHYVDKADDTKYSTTITETYNETENK